MPDEEGKYENIEFTGSAIDSQFSNLDSSASDRKSTLCMKWNGMSNSCIQI